MRTITRFIAIASVVVAASVGFTAAAAPQTGELLAGPGIGCC